MTWPLWSILVAGLLPYAGTAIAKWGFRRYDNHHPREWLAQQTGYVLGAMRLKRIVLSPFLFMRQPY